MVADILAGIAHTAIGMSTAMQLIDLYPDARIALLEKESAPACHQTGHNSGVIHAG
ncbi:FAD-dependent oxidoreductase, partial [Salmonella enterica subsp. enterica serovar Kentucky]|nr:FAD-dependent oxidoreductase [Salmonella enterica subsp. enterica serovar Kentucky]